MKKLIFGLITSAALISGFSVASEAKVNFNVYLGVPYYDQKIGPDYIYDENHGWYQQNYQPVYHSGNGQKQVCLVTFFRRDQVSAGADADVQRARVLPQQIARRYDRPNDRNRIFFYGSNQKTRDTCRYLNGLNNQQQSTTQDRVCLVTFFDSSQVSGGADANVDSARFLPRRIAEQRERSDDRSRIFVYGNDQKTRDTCSYLNGINN